MKNYQCNFYHSLYQIVFCDEKGQVQEPKTPLAYIEAYKSKGVEFETEKFEIQVSNNSWVFKKGQAPLMKSIPLTLIREVLNHM